MALPRATDAEVVSSGGSGGTLVGETTTEKVGFHGTAPIAQTTLTTLATAATLATIRTSVQQIISKLRAKGLFG